MTALTEVEDKRVRALLARLYDAWAAGDARAYADCFTVNCDYVTFNGIRLRGRAENTEFHDALFRGVLKGTKLTAAIESIDPIADEIVLLHTAASGLRKSRQTFVIVNQNGEWLIRSFQNTRVRPFGVRFTRWLQKRAAR